MTDLHNVNIIATTAFTSSGLELMSELRGYSKTITEWTASAGKINYLHVGDWYFSGSFSQSRKPGGTALQAKPQTEGYEVICGQGRKAKWAVYDRTYNPFTNTPKNTITASIKTINGMPTDGHNPL